jgi:hypothetical protein
MPDLSGAGSPQRRWVDVSWTAPSWYFSSSEATCFAYRVNEAPAVSSFQTIEGRLGGEACVGAPRVWSVNIRGVRSRPRLSLRDRPREANPHRLSQAARASSTVVPRRAGISCQLSPARPEPSRAKAGRVQQPDDLAPSSSFKWALKDTHPFGTRRHRAPLSIAKELVPIYNPLHWPYNLLNLA